MRIIITGSDGFIGKNLSQRLLEQKQVDVIGISRTTPQAIVQDALSTADIVFHLAGVNRPKDINEFEEGNVGFTSYICEQLATAGRRATFVLASSVQASIDNPYGRSKHAAECAVRAYGLAANAKIHILRLTNVFGKWAKPNYNSAVATFCFNIARGLPITVHDSSAPLRLAYIDDVVDELLACISSDSMDCGSSLSCNTHSNSAPIYSTTVGEVVELLESFATSRTALTMPAVGTGFIRKLYSTYVSYLPPGSFEYEVPRYQDSRGEFVEMLKTPNCGQFSYFTAHPGVTRGEHYHHTKTEKFLVIKGTARFGFRHIVTGENYELVTSGGEAKIVETAPGWTHNVTNVGDDELIVMLWANEVFDRERPDTIGMKVM